jgi:hypothetical protein
MADHQVVLAVFPDEAAADAAVESLKSWDKVTDEVKLGAIGVLVMDDKGNLKEHKIGARSGKKGAGIGLALAIIAPPTLLAGVVGGGLIGHLHHKGLGLSWDNRDQLGIDLVGGKAAVGVLATDEEAGMVAGKLNELGGAVELVEVTADALDAAAAAAETAPEADAEAATAPEAAPGAEPEAPDATA